MATFSERSKNNLKGIHPDLVRVMEQAIKDTPIDFTITDGVRTSDQQWRLYLIGREKPGKIVTNCDGTFDKSNHQRKADGYGHAVDIYTWKNGKLDVNDVDGLKVVSAHIKECAKRLGIAIGWGGDWKTKDYPHFELK